MTVRNRVWEWEEFHTFGQDFPFARLRSLVGRNLGPKILKKVFHFASSFSLRHLVTHSKSRRATIRLRSLFGSHGIVLVEVTHLILLKGMVVRAWHCTFQSKQRR